MNVRSLRKAKGWTQLELAKRAGIPQSQISRIEQDIDTTTVRTLKRVASALGVPASLIIEEEVEEEGVIEEEGLTEEFIETSCWIG